VGFCIGSGVRFVAEKHVTLTVQAYTFASLALESDLLSISFLFYLFMYGGYLVGDIAGFLLGFVIA